MIIPEGQFSEKSHAAIQRNFAQVTDKDKKIRKNALSLLIDLNLGGLAADVKKSEKSCLDIFCYCQNPQEWCAVPRYCEGRNTWQYVVSGFLQKHLNSLKVQDPFCITNSEALVRFLQADNPPWTLPCHQC